MIKNCKICNIEFNAREKATVICKNKICVSTYRKEKYANRLLLKNCKICNKEFSGTKKAFVCSIECKETPKDKKYEIIQTINCKYCNCFINTKIKKVNIFGKNTVATEIKRVCIECKTKNFKDWGERQTGENNTNWKEIKSTKRNRKYTDDERKIKMSIYNPMKNKDVADKVSKTLKLKYENGEIIRPLGKLSPLYKGNRTRSYSIRDRLKEWKVRHLKECDYTCQRCLKRGGKLEVHHETPFRELLKLELNGRILEDISYEDFEILCTNIVEQHKNIKGTVLCIPCHKIIDEYRK